MISLARKWGEKDEKRKAWEIHAGVLVLADGRRNS
jgi:hypothetical protein